MDDDLQQRFLQWRGVEDPCLRCHGVGQRAYASGATWRGGMGAACMQQDVCDACWGTGDRYRSGCDLRRLRDEEEKRIAERAIEEIAKSCGATFASSRWACGEIMQALDKMADKRGRDFMSAGTIVGLRNVLARALGVQERKL